MTAPTSCACVSRSATPRRPNACASRWAKASSARSRSTRQSILLNDVSTSPVYIPANPDVRSELAVPLIAKNRLIGVIDLESEKADYFRPEHLHLLTLTASRIAQAIENARLYARVSRQAQTLTVLNEISMELTSILDLDPLLERVGQLLRRLIDYQMFTIMLLDEKGETLITRYAWRFGYSHAPLRRIPITSGLVGASVREWRVVNVPDVRKDPRYLEMNPETRSEMIVPLFHKGRIIGVLDLEHTRTGFFNEEHERMLTTWRRRSPSPSRMRGCTRRSTRQEKQLERDIAMAREVQLRLLPRAAPEHTHADMAVRFLPARTIGGDLYDFLDYGPNQTAIVLGDVSGKAAPAALFAALVSGIMRSAAHQQLQPAAMLAMLNDALQERRLDSQYVTMLFAVWNDENQTLQVANSGAVQPIFCRAGEVESRCAPRAFRWACFPTSPTTSSPSPPSPATSSSSSPTEFSTPKTSRARCTARTGSRRGICGERKSQRRADRRCHSCRCNQVSGWPRPLRRRDDHRAESALRQGPREQGTASKTPQGIPIEGLPRLVRLIPCSLRPRSSPPC